MLIPLSLHRAGLCGDLGCPRSCHVPWAAASRALVLPEGRAGVFVLPWCCGRPPVIGAPFALCDARAKAKATVISAPEWRSSLPEPQGLSHSPGWVLVSPEGSREGQSCLCVSREGNSGEWLSAVELTQTQNCGCGLEQEKHRA